MTGVSQDKMFKGLKRAQSEDGAEFKVGLN